jgi:hypothetical protein
VIDADRRLDERRTLEMRHLALPDIQVDQVRSAAGKLRRIWIIRLLVVGHGRRTAQLREYRIPLPWRAAVVFREDAIDVYAPATNRERAANRVDETVRGLARDDARPIVSRVPAWMPRELDTTRSSRSRAARALLHDDAKKSSVASKRKREASMVMKKILEVDRRASCREPVTGLARWQCQLSEHTSFKPDAR